MRVLARSFLAILLAAEAVLIGLAVQPTYQERPVLIYESAAIAVFAVAVAVLTRTDLPRRVGLGVVVGFGVVLEAIAAHRPPVDSDDDYRYLWDGKVQLAGIDPYRYAPSSTALAHVRDRFLFPPGSHCGVHPFAGGCTRINLPTAHTIYPPVAEALFALVRFGSGGRGGQFPLQVAAALGTLAVTLLLARRGRPVWTLALWAWCPVPVIELCNNAHIDWLAVLFGVLALTASARGRVVAAGVLLGAGITTKLYPGLLGAAMLKKRPWVLIATTAATIVLVYAPHVLAVGGSVIGYLPTYLNQGGYGNGQQYRLLSPLLPTVLVTPAAVLIIAGVLLWSLRNSDPLHPERAALVVVGVAMLVATPTLPWYTVLLLALAALSARPEWLGVVVAPTVEYLSVGAEHASLGPATSVSYLGGLLVLIVGTALRRWVRTGSRPAAVAASR